MKYAFMTFSCPELTLDKVLATAKRFGYDGVEPRIASDHRHGIERTLSASERAQVRKTAAAAGIRLCCIATSHSFADPANSAKEIEGAVASVRLAADVGAPCVRVFGGQLPSGVSREQAIDLLVKSLSRIARETASLNVTVCLETHDHWCDPAHVVEVMKRVNHPRIAVNWDLLHPVRTASKTVEEAFSQLKPWIQHVHFHDGIVPSPGKFTYVPMGTGIVDHRAALRLLKAARYAGYLSGEWIGWEPWETHLPRELAMMKKYEQEQ